MLGGVTERVIDVYVPAGHDGRGLGLLVDIVGFTAGGPAHTNWKNFGENMPERLDRLIADGAMGPCVVAFPGLLHQARRQSIYRRRARRALGRFLIQECVPFVEETFGCQAEWDGVGCLGKSSGGYGSIVHALLYPDFWAAAAFCILGDMAFELCYIPEFPRLLRKLAKYENWIQKWLEKFYEATKTRDDDIHDLMTLAMCASYDPRSQCVFGRTVAGDDRHMCEIIEQRWWLDWDDVRNGPDARRRADEDEGAVGRLRRYGSIQYGLWRAATAPIVGGAGYQTCVRGIFR